MTTAHLSSSEQANPFMSILNPQFKYTPSVATNIVDTYRKYGWTPPSETHKAQGQSTMEP